MTLANTGVASGNCLQFSGATIIGGACGTGGGGSALTGCSTPSAGNLACDSSVLAGTGNEGTLSLAYSSLPNPPSTAVGQFAIDATGSPFYSPGSNAAWQRLVLGNQVPSPGGVTILQ
jgi:hypothetical protein